MTGRHRGWADWPTRFEQQYIPEPMSGCWLWTGTLAGRDQRPRLCFDGKQGYAHRASWLLHRGPIPDGLQVLHRCDTPLCVNPNHLFLGTQLDNVRDAKAKGRHRPPPRPPGKLTQREVWEIRQLHGHVLQRVLAAMYGVSQTRIEQILRTRR